MNCSIISFLFSSLVGILSPVLIHAAQQPIETIAFGSCLKQTRPQPIWESVLQQKPDILFFSGTISMGTPEIWKNSKVNGMTFH